MTKLGKELSNGASSWLSNEEARKALGVRLKRAREILGLSQAQFSASFGASIRGIQDNESGKTVPGGQALAALAMRGINVNWLLTGDGPERLANETSPLPGSQSPGLADLTLAIQLAEEALEGGVLEPPDYAQLVTLIYDALVNGLPNAQVLAFAKPAARGLSHGRRHEDNKPSTGSVDHEPAGKGKTAA